MKLIDITLEGVGKFTRKTRVSGFSDGINTLNAPNEFGKSTIFSALRACILERHNSRNEILRRMVSYGSALPVSISVTFDHGDTSSMSRYVISKSFLKSPSASLTKDGIEISKGREADEKLWELLGIQPGVRRTGCDDASLGMLWVPQGASFSPVDLTPAGKSVLSASIDAEIGHASDGVDTESLLASIETDIAELVTGTGRPKSGRKLALALTAMEETAAAIADLERRIADTEAMQSDLIKRRAERIAIADPAERARLVGDLRLAEALLNEGRRATNARATADALLVSLTSAATAARQVMEDAQATADRIDAARDQEHQIEAEQRAIESLEPSSGSDGGSMALCRAALTTLDARLTMLDSEDREALECLRLADDGSAQRYRSALVALDDLTNRAASVEASLRENPVTQDIVEDAVRLRHEIVGLNDRIEFGAIELVVRPLTLDRRAILLDGTPMDGDRHLLSDTTILTVGDHAIFEITPSAQSRAAGATSLQGAAQQRHERRIRLTDLYQKLGIEISAATPEIESKILELRRRRAARALLESEQHKITIELGVQASIVGLPVSDPAESNTVAVQFAKAKILTALADHEAEVQRLLTRLDRDGGLPSVSDIRSWQDRIAEDRAQTQAEKSRMEGQNEAMAAHRERQAAAKGVLAGRLAEIRNRIAADLVHLPDVDRSERLASHTAAWQAADKAAQNQAEIVADMVQATPSQDEMERRIARVGRLNAALDANKIRAADLDRTIANLEGQLQNAGGEGLGEKLTVLQQKHGLHERSVHRCRRIVDSLTLLRDTLLQAKQARQQKLAAPLLRHLRPLLSDVFGESSLAIDADFKPVGFRRSDQLAFADIATASQEIEDDADSSQEGLLEPAHGEAFNRLSLGTQEQVALLVRLAMGGLIAEQIGPVPVILDDSLVYADDERTDAMFDAYARAARRQQVIILSCHRRAYAALGGTPLVVEEV
jgi:hypothetical protein